MKVNALIEEQKKAFKDKTAPEVAEIIAQTLRNEGNETMDAFPAAVKAAE